ncbi:MAG: glycosyltransferase family 4 protein [Rickettsiales bacterium]|nr:glycosyltransferase family 4 protein [Rickettsiales bacterium]
MDIAIVMLSRGYGGIEQAFIDYCEGLKARGNRVLGIVDPKAGVIAQLQELSIPYVTLSNMGQWDIWAARKLRKILTSHHTHIVIAGSNRSYSLAKKAIKGLIPLVGVAHNYSTERLTDADGVFAITQDLTKHLLKQGIQEDHIFRIPNMVRCRELPHRAPRNNPPIIGSMGRFVKKKGFDIYIDALRILRERGYRFRAVLGGEGLEGRALKKQAFEAGLKDQMLFLGWVQDKKEFYSRIDIFCLPSHHEPFGIVLLEAFNYGTPVVATNSEGPIDIITPNYDAILVDKGSASALADGLAKLLDDNALADSLAANAFAKTKTVFAIEVVAERIEKACETMVSRWRR